MPSDKGRANSQGGGRRSSRGHRKTEGARSRVGREVDPVSGAAGSNCEGTDGLDARLEQAQLTTRRLLFGLLVVALAVISLWFVVTTLRRSPGEDRVSLVAGVRYTVKVGEVPSGHRRTAEAMLTHPGLVSIARDHRPFLQDMPGEGIALCVGSFESGDCREAKELLARLRSYTEDGRHAFRSAVIWGYTPGRPQ